MRFSGRRSLHLAYVLSHIRHFGVRKRFTTATPKAKVQVVRATSLQSYAELQGVGHFKNFSL
jgi:hypothetical protein